MTNFDELITAYEVDVRFPDVSGMEHLQMLMTRSRIAEAEREYRLNSEQRLRLAEADQMLLSQAGRFYEAIQRIADLAAWRDQENITSEQWWWYMDVLVRLPQPAVRELERVAA